MHASVALQAHAAAEKLAAALSGSTTLERLGVKSPVRERGGSPSRARPAVAAAAASPGRQTASGGSTGSSGSSALQRTAGGTKLAAWPAVSRPNPYQQAELAPAPVGSFTLKQSFAVRCHWHSRTAAQLLASFFVLHMNVAAGHSAAGMPQHCRPCTFSLAPFPPAAPAGPRNERVITGAAPQQAHPGDWQ